MILGKDIEIPNDVSIEDISDGYHSFKELYTHRIELFLTLMTLASLKGYECGWSEMHSDAEPFFGGGWCIGWIVSSSGKEIRYYFRKEHNAPKFLKKEIGKEWNEKEETIDGLIELRNSLI